MKRIVSLLIAAAMLISLVPSAFAAEKGEQYTYLFTYSAAGCTAETDFASGDPFSYAGVEGAGLSSPWDFIGGRSLKRALMKANGFYARSSSYDCANPNNATVFKIKVAKSGKYIPSLTYSQYFLGTIVNVYLISASEIDAKSLNMADGGGGGGIKNVLQNYSPIGCADTYGAVTNENFSAANLRTATFDAQTLSAGEYYLLFEINGMNPNVATGQSLYYYLIRSFGLDGTAPKSLNIKCDNTELDIGESASITAEVTYESGNVYNSKGLEYKSSDTNVITVSNSGVVSAVSNGKAKVTVSVPETSLSKEIELEVLGEDTGNAGVVLNYITNSYMMLDQTEIGDRVGMTSGVIRSGTYFDEYSEIDLSKTSPWRYVSHIGNSMNIDRPQIFANVKTYNYGSATQQGMLALAIKVSNKGDYIFSVKPNRRGDGTKTDIYIIPSTGGAVSRTVLSGKTPVGSLDFQTSAGGSVLTKIAKVSFPVRGEYYVIFDMVGGNGNTVTNSDTQAMAVCEMQLKACSGEFANSVIEIDGVEENEPMPLGTVRDIKAKLLDENMMELDEIDESKLEIDWKVSNESIAKVSNGKIEALSCGEAKVTADISYNGKNVSAGFDILVAPTGKNLFTDRNEDFEDETWRWNRPREDVMPKTPQFMTVGIGVSPKDGDEDNRAMKVTFDSSVAAEVRPDEISLLRNGSRIPVTPGRFYNLTFKMKIEDYKKPLDASEMQLICDLYAFGSETSTSAVGNCVRAGDIAIIQNYRDVYGDWATYSLPIIAPFDADYETIYVSPRIVFRPQDNDLPKKGYEGTVWFDDFELREVGFTGIEIESAGDFTKEDTKPVLNVRAVASNGEYMSLSADALTGISAVSSDERIVTTPADWEVTGVKASGRNYLTATSELGGKIGKGEIEASLTLGGITRKGVCEIETALPVKLLWAEASLDNSTVKAGETAKLSYTAYMSDSSVADISGGICEYSSSDESVATVDAEGNVTTHRAGKALITVTLGLNGSSCSASAEITATDLSPIVSATLTAPESVGYLRDAAIKISGVCESGLAADINAANVEYVIDSDPVGAVSISNGFVFGEIYGATAKVFARVTLNGATVTTNTVEIAVTETDLRDFVIDFRKASSSKISEITIEKDNWRHDLENSHYLTANSTFATYGLTANTNWYERVFAIDVNIPYSGVYNIVFTGEIRNTGAETSYIYFDDMFIGDYSFYASSPRDSEPKSMRTFYLTAGLHKMIFRPVGVNQVSKNYNQMLTAIRFAAKDNLPAVSEIELSKNKLELVCGDTAEITAKMITADGCEFDGSKTYSGANDPIAQITFKSLDESVAKVDENGLVTAISDGETTVRVTAKNSVNSITRDISVKVDGSNINFATLETDRRTFYVGEEFELSAKAYLASGAELSSDKMSVVWSSDDTSVVSISGNTLKAEKEGSTTLRGKVTYYGGEMNIAEEVTVEKDSFGAVEITSPSFTLRPDGDSVKLSVVGKTYLEKDVDITGAEINWQSDNTSVATVDESGIVTPVGKGSANITATVTLNGKTVTGTAMISVREGKVSGTYYTPEMIEAARENTAKYTWAKNIKKDATAIADQFVGLEDTMWEMITGEGLPRSNGVGFNNDPMLSYCRYCGENLATYSGGSWRASPLTRPWKIQCPACKRYFPSNDFTKLYELGRDEHGVYDRAIAHSRNDELVANGEQGYLKNVLYPEAEEKFGDPDWGVDDGFGYDTGRIYPSGVKEVHTYIGMYNHWGLWFSNSTTTSGTIQMALQYLTNAYIYTGDPKYGRVGAIMVDRIADLYPDYDLRPYLAVSTQAYPASDGGAKTGKILGQIWENYIAEDFAKAYDAFFPMYDDPQVVSFLSKKAEKYNLENKKDTPEKIRQNIEDGILREIFKAVKNAQIRGNFGMLQSTLATSAIVLDSKPESDEMINFIFKYGACDPTSYNNGGNVNKTLIDDVSRDGQGNESSPGYNRLWLDELLSVSQTLAKDPDNELNFYDNPKYMAMLKSYPAITLVRQGVPSIGDTGGPCRFPALPDNFDNLIEGFKHTGDIEIAQHLYFLLNNDLSSVHYDVYTKNPESLRSDIKQIIDTYGEYDYDQSSILTGYGFAVLRAGTLHKSAESGINDTQRDFWMYFGGAVSHNHEDKLGLGLEAYGICLSPDLGYPEKTGSDPNRYQWINNSLSHNLVVVNEQTQLTNIEPYKPLHFDANDKRVRLMDVDGAGTYIETDEYRRTVVMIDYDDDISYGIDFFKVLGGDDHLYSFHAASEEVYETSDNLKFKEQIGGTYASPFAPFGEDPYTNFSSQYTVLKYPRGYTWLENVRRADNPKTGEFFVDYKIKDMARLSRNEKMDIHLRVTMLNDFDLSEVSLATGLPPRTAKNLENCKYIQYMLARRKGKDLDSLFTTVLEPYNKERYIKSIESVPVTVIDGAFAEHQAAKALKVELCDGRCDYIVYSQNRDVTLDVGGIFKFRGFIGVYTVNEEGKNIYSYINDGDLIGDAEMPIACVTGKVCGFTKELSFENKIDVELDAPADVTALAGRLINVEHEGLGNASYIIESADKTDDTHISLNLGNVTLIDKYKDDEHEELGYVYDIAEGQRFEIAMSYSDNAAPVFEQKDDIAATAGSVVSFNTLAESALGEKITYSAKRLPRGASFNEETGTVTWKPDSSQIGENVFAIVATDESGRTTEQYFTVTVYGATTGGGGGAGGGAGGGTTPSNPDDGKKEDEESGDNTGDNENENQGDNTGDKWFIDVPTDSWFYEPIKYVFDNGIMNGMSEEIFAPNTRVNRGMFVTVLYRMAGEPDVELTDKFTDVAPNAYYAKAVAWASEKGVVKGISETEYGPNNDITREQKAAMLYRNAEANGEDVSFGEVKQFADTDKVSEYAKDAVSYCIAKGLIAGKTETEIKPQDFATRAEVATILMRILKNK